MFQWEKNPLQNYDLFYDLYTEAEKEGFCKGCDPFQH